MRLKSILKAGVATAGMAIAASIGSVPARAGTINFTYNFTGGLTAAPVLVGTTLMLAGAASGSVVSAYPSLNAVWNPVSIVDTSGVDLTTGLATGLFTMTFSNGEKLFGSLFEDDSAVLATNTGPFTEKLTFTGGTGEFAGASGSIAGGGVLGATGYTTSLSGAVSGPGVVPEPGTVGLMATGLLGAAGAVRRRLFA